MHKISIVIPGYNEEKRIGDSLKKIGKYLKDRKLDYEIIFVDDGSKDNTLSVVEKCRKDLKLKIRMMSYKQNHGKGYAVRKGILAANHPLVLFSDSDLATPIEELNKFLKFIDKGFDIVIASRRMKNSNIVVKQSGYRHVGGAILPLLIKMLAVRGFKDTQCGFKLFKTAKAKKIAKLQTLENFSFDVEQLFIAQKMGLKIKEVPVTWIDKAGSKVNFIKDGFSMLNDLFKIRKNNIKGKYEVK